MEHLDDSRNQGECNPKKRCRLSKMEEREEDDNVIWLDSPPSRTHVESKTDEERAQLSFPHGLDIPMHLNKNKGTKSLVSEEMKELHQVTTYRLLKGKRVKTRPIHLTPQIFFINHHGEPKALKELLK
ncbi:hypothetical protein MKX01_029188 [Papaver californicum]|nr:hypothetical protein MKX01_029188 [Papaver californicum]